MEGVAPERYFAYHLPDSTLDRFWVQCDACCDGGVQGPQSSAPEEEYNALDSLLLEVHQDDQRYRGPGKDFSKQAYFDEMNRNVLDSIYHLMGFPSRDEINRSSQSTLWLVIHHSTDCAWTAKWLSRAYELIDSGDLDEGHYEQTFHRFFHSKTGHCASYRHLLTRDGRLQQLMERY